MAPTLFKKAKRKNITVHKALQESKWISHILPILTAEEIQEYIKLWETVQQIVLDPDREDTIVWRWTADGEYTTKSAYHIQFEGTFNRLKIMPIWRAKTEPKCIFLHGRCFTIRSSWPTI
jgi:hypothetical protein